MPGAASYTPSPQSGTPEAFQINDLKGFFIF